LAVDAWPANTRLYKFLDKSGLQIECRPPEKPQGRRKVLDEARLCRWLEAWSSRRHDARLRADAARTLLDLVGPQFGLLDQELAKLALFAGPGGEVTATMVKDVVGGWRTKTVWEFLDAALDGNAAEALRQLDRLFQSGEHPLALLGPISPALRRFATATRIYERGEKQGHPVTLRDALLQAGVPNWPKAIENAERQLKRLGRQRAGAMFRWLLEADLAIKGTHSSPERARFVLERLVFRMAGLDRIASSR
jgi:DNA polymerase-3 subunit delta